MAGGEGWHERLHDWTSQRHPWVHARLRTDRWYGLYLTLILAIAALGLRLFWAVAEDLVEAEFLSQADPFVSQALFALRSSALTRVMWIATVLGGPRVIIALVALAVGLFLMWGRSREAIVLAIASGSGALVADVLKQVVGRSRPAPSFALIATPESFAFPSGHAMGSIVFFGLMGLMILRLLKRADARVAILVASGLAILAVGVSRVYLGVHWMTDVLGSWALGVTWVGVGFLALLTWDRFSPRPPLRPLFGRRVRYLLTALAIAAAALAVITGSLADPLLHRVAEATLSARAGA